MKKNPLLLEHISPYERGQKFVIFTSRYGETFRGVIEKITTSATCGKVILELELEFRVMLRTRKFTHVDNSGLNTSAEEAISGSGLMNKSLLFVRPIVSGLDPLSFTSEGDKVQIFYRSEKTANIINSYSFF
ncbi:MAG: hypothetical protein WCV79_02115 [Candidatus Paceibacterota bacterium]